MDISKSFDQKILQEILINIYVKSQENKEINVLEIINDIENQLKNAINQNK